MFEKRLFLGVAALALLTVPAAAQELAGMAVAPWTEESGRETPGPALALPPTPVMERDIPDDLGLKRLSLADLQALATPDGALSPLEGAYGGRIVEDLRQFGYDMFAAAGKKGPQTTLPAGTVQDDYILSAGDNLTGNRYANQGEQ